MATQDRTCTLAPYFEVHAGELDKFKALCEQCVTKTQNEAGCKYYGFCFSGDEALCREAYDDAAGVLAHLDNVGELQNQKVKRKLFPSKTLFNHPLMVEKLVTGQNETAMYRSLHLGEQLISDYCVGDVAGTAGHEL